MYATVPVYVDTCGAGSSSVRVVREYWYCPCCSHYSCSCSCCCSRKRTRKRTKSLPPLCHSHRLESAVVLDCPAVTRTRIISAVTPCYPRTTTCVYYWP